MMRGTLHWPARAALVGAAALLVAACGDSDSPDVFPAEGVAAATNAAAAAAQSARMAEAQDAPPGLPGAVTGKPVAPIAIRYEILGEPVVGVPLEIAISAEPQSDMSAVTVVVRGGTELTLASNPAEGPFDVRAGESTSRVVVIIPTVAGRHHLSVLVEGLAAGQPQARTVMIPVQVGSAAMAAPSEPAVRTDEAGERIHALPAQETQ